MPIEFLDLLDSGGWEPLSPDPGTPGWTWSEGGTLADAPVDVRATFDDAAWRAREIDPTFGLTGIRLRGGFTVPRHHHSRALLLLVVGGAVTVRSPGPAPDDGAADEEAQLGSGQFCIIDDGTAYTLTAGDRGVTFLSSWPQEAPELVTCWYPDPAWAER